MLLGRAAAWPPAKFEKAQGADLGDPHLCGRADRPAVEPGALQPQHAAPTRAPSPELEPVFRLCKSLRAVAVDFLPP